MRVRLVLPHCMLLLIVVFAFGCTRGKGHPTFVDNNAATVCWSKDGRALFYTIPVPGGYQLRRYDIDTGRKHAYTMVSPDTTEGFRDISPDEKQMLSWHGDHLSIVDLQTGKQRNIRVTKQHKGRLPWEQDDIDHQPAWLKQDKILFAEGTYKLRNAYLLDPHTMRVDRLSKTHVRYALPAVDGQSFFYDSLRDGYHIFDLRTGTDRKIRTKRLAKNRTFTFLYLSDRLLVYTTFDPPTQVFEMLDLRSMKTLPIKMVYHEMYQEGQISPDLKRQWFSGPLGQDTQPGNLCLQEIPEETVRRMRALR